MKGRNEGTIDERKKAERKGKKDRERENETRRKEVENKRNEKTKYIKKRQERGK